MKRQLLFLVFFLSIFTLRSDTSLAQVQQKISGHIDGNMDANISEYLSNDTNLYSSLNFLLPVNVGISAVNYKLIGASDSAGPIQYSYKGNYEYNFPFNRTGLGFQDVRIDFKVPPALVSPTFVGFDFAPLVGLKDTTLNITYPLSLEFIGSKPESSTRDKVSVHYPESQSAGIVEINFIQKNLPEGYRKVEEGRFVIVGTEDEIANLRKVVAPLSFLPELYTDTLGKFDLDKIWIFSANFAGKGNFLHDAGAFMRSDNIILMDKSVFTNSLMTTLEMQKTIIHELTHSIVQRNTFHGEEKYTPWFDEGIAVFVENYAADKYLVGKDYWIAENEQGQPAVFLDYSFRFTRDQLIQRYKEGNFYYDVPKNDKVVNDFYYHAGLVFYNFFLKTDGDLKSFVARLATLYSSGANCNTCDTNRILKIMEEMSGMTREQILFPYKNDPDFQSKISYPLIVRDQYTQEEVDKMLQGSNNTSLSLTEGQSLALIFSMLGVLFVAIVVGIIFVAKKRKER